MLEDQETLELDNADDADASLPSASSASPSAAKPPLVNAEDELAAATAAASRLVAGGGAGSSSDDAGSAGSAKHQSGTAALAAPRGPEAPEGAEDQVSTDDIVFIIMTSSKTEVERPPCRPCFFFRRCVCLCVSLTLQANLILLRFFFSSSFVAAFPPRLRAVVALRDGALRCIVVVGCVQAGPRGRGVAHVGQRP